jgi:hypothetical protein
MRFSFANPHALAPTLGGWEYLWPRSHPQEDLRLGIAPAQVNWLGQAYVLESTNQNVSFTAPREIRKLALRPDALIGVPSNTRTKDDTRRFDGSDYQMVHLSPDNYGEMIRAGLNCFQVDSEQAGWLKDEPVFYWGIGGQELLFPECLYRSTYLGAALFLDEPAVGTQDYDIRPRLAKDPAFRHALTPQIVLEEFKRHCHNAVSAGAPAAFLKGLPARTDLDLGTMDFPQNNLYSTSLPPSKSAAQRKPIVLQRSRPGQVIRNLVAKFAGRGPPSMYQPDPFAANQAPPRMMQNLVRPSLRWLSVHCHTLPHMS